MEIQFSRLSDKARSMGKLICSVSQIFSSLKLFPCIDDELLGSGDVEICLMGRLQISFPVFSISGVR